MPLVTLKELMKDAEAKRYAVGAYNVINLEMIRGIIAGAEEARSPVILPLRKCIFRLFRWR
ncbi:class II fructose-bisphosphate aldolase [Paenibacillus sp. FSL P2-0089]|uniref:class II fructose-bisphosphate aldolase n=1 Tax=Paenibacillus sp. FSL P2-0089 TaxID=2954526 RepID=UPI00315AB5E8